MDFDYFSPAIDKEMHENAAGLGNGRVIRIRATPEFHAISMYSALQELTRDGARKNLNVTFLYARAWLK